MGGKVGGGGGGRGRASRETSSESEESDSASSNEISDGEGEGDENEEVETGGMDVAERIVGHKITSSGTLYLVNWRGWEEEDNTWEPVARKYGDDGVSRELVRDYNNQLHTGKTSINAPRQHHQPT
jgi:hypothetical protein